MHFNRGRRPAGERGVNPTRNASEPILFPFAMATPNTVTAHRLRRSSRTDPRPPPRTLSAHVVTTHIGKP
jgi:hypothetical protein